jgi:hypothetical protein
MVSFVRVAMLHGIVAVRLVVIKVFCAGINEACKSVSTQLYL